MKSSKQILPSVMAKNQAELNALFKKLEGSANFLHLDVSDGKFVKSKVMDFDFRLSSKFSYGVHLMVKDARKYIERLERKKKIKYFVASWESFSSKKKRREFISWLQKKKMLVAFAIKPGTKVIELKEDLREIDMVLVLTVHPGRYGARFLKSPLKKVSQLKKLKESLTVVVDGGMKPSTIALAGHAGADYFVSGSFVSRSSSPKKAVKELERALFL